VRGGIKGSRGRSGEEDPEKGRGGGSREGREEGGGGGGGGRSLGMRLVITTTHLWDCSVIKPLNSKHNSLLTEHSSTQPRA